MLYLKTSVKNGIISLYPLNPDEMYYKCEVCGNFYGIDNLSDFSFDDDVFLKDYICPQWTWTRGRISIQNWKGS